MKTRTMNAAELPNGDLTSIELATLERLFDLHPDMAFFVKNRAGQYVVVNDSLLARHGLKRKSEAIGKRPQEICPGDFGRFPTEQDQRVLSTGKPLFDYLEMQLFRPGAPVWCLTTKLPLRNRQGQVVGLIGFSRDLRASVSSHEIPLAFAQALARFEKDPGSEVSPAVLAEQAGLSPSRLARLTKKLFSLTPSQWIAKTRVTVASGYLRESQLSIVEIAQRCGYSDQSAFTRAFRALTGSTPTDFRKRCREVN